MTKEVDFSQEAWQNKKHTDMIRKDEDECQMPHQLVLVMDFGGQYNQLIARRVREANVYCEVCAYDTPLEQIRAGNPIGIIFTGGPNSAYEQGVPTVSRELFELGIPILGICYGAQITAISFGGSVKSPDTREYGRTTTHLDTGCPLFKGLPAQQLTWMSHMDYIDAIPEGFVGVAKTGATPYAAYYHPEKKIYGLQFHPEVEHTEYGREILRAFLFKVCGARGDWTMEDYAQTMVESLRSRIGAGKVVLALSGGVDSSVAAALLAKAVGSQLTCIFVDHGLMRKNEGDEVEAAFGGRELHFIRVNAQKRFLDKLAGITDPERKRKIIGEEFIRVFEDEALKLGEVDFLAQGTIYPDIIESGTKDAAVIKSHHNVGGLPEHVHFKEIVEPLRLLFKDEVRALGTALGLPDYLVWRQPFPGPGLAVRVIGDITEEKLVTLRDADFIFRDELAKAKLDRKVHQYFAVLTNMRSVGVMGDERTYDYTLALRGVTTTDFMTADWARIPYEVLERVSNRIINEVRGINRIVYDITSKPPSTIEWE